MVTGSRLELSALLLLCHRRSTAATHGAMRLVVPRHRIDPSFPLVPNATECNPDLGSIQGRRGHPSPSGTSIGESTNNAMGGRKAEEGSR